MLREIKQQFMAFRNGVVADTLRKGGWHHKIIFGLQYPQLKSIAADIKNASASSSGKGDEADEYLADLGRELWADSDVRESRVLATMLMPQSQIDEEEALQMLLSVNDCEEGDALCFYLLGRMPFAATLANRAFDMHTTRAQAYAIESLHRNFRRFQEG